MNHFDFLSGPSNDFIQDLESIKKGIQERDGERDQIIKFLTLFYERHLQAVILLNRTSDELYNNGMSPKLLADILAFLHPTGCEANNE